MEGNAPWYEIPWLFGFTVSQAWVFLSPLIAGGFAVWLNELLRRSSEKKRKREEWLAIQLSGAFELICDALEHPGMPADTAFERKLKLEKAINLLHLYGDERIRKAANAIVDGYEKNEKWILYTPLLKELRDAFRSNMGLDAATEEVRTIKFAFGQASKSNEESEAKK